MTSSEILLTIITPTYNRGHLIKNCYSCLQLQTQYNFEWIIVDDGSEDDTVEVVEKFSIEKFPIIYIKKENGGKHTALNAAHSYIHGKYVLILDSDDTLIPTATEDVIRQWKKFQDNDEIGFLVFLRCTNAGIPICTVDNYDIPVEILRCHRNIGIASDCCEVIRTELFKKFVFPVFEGERFLSEGVLWNRVAITHKCVYINQAIYVCEYLEDGLTKSGKSMRIRNPLGGMYNSEICMQKKNFLYQRIKKGILYCCYSFFAKLSPKEILGRTKYKFLAVICLLPGYGLYCYWKKKYK